MSHASHQSPAEQLARRVLLVKALTIVFLLAAWECLSRSGLFYAGVLPHVSAIALAVVDEVRDGSFYHDLGITMLETGVGFLFGAGIALALGIWLGSSRFARQMLDPYITAIGSTPKIIFLPILFLVFGLGLESKIAKAALSAFFPVVLTTTNGFLQIPPVLLRVGVSFNLGRWQMVRKIYLPAMVNPLMTSLRLGIAMAIIGVLSAEITYANVGLGYRLIHDADQFRIPSVYALTILIFALSAGINSAISKLQARFNRHEQRRARTASLAAAKPALGADIRA